MSIFKFNSILPKSQSIAHLKRGFLLLEVLLGVLLVAIAVSSLGLWFVSLTNQRMFFVNRIKAINYACNILEEIKAYKKVDLDFTRFQPEGFTFKLDTKIDCEIKDLKKITVYVYDPGKKNTITLSTEVYMG